jgi:hypothetical protein
MTLMSHLCLWVNNLKRKECLYQWRLQSVTHPKSASAVISIWPSSSVISRSYSCCRLERLVKVKIARTWNHQANQYLHTYWYWQKLVANWDPEQQTLRWRCVCGTLVNVLRINTHGREEQLQLWQEEKVGLSKSQPTWEALTRVILQHNSE